jgi:hypothetical protein
VKQIPRKYAARQSMQKVDKLHGRALEIADAIVSALAKHRDELVLAGEAQRLRELLLEIAFTDSRMEAPCALH